MALEEVHGGRDLAKLIMYTVRFGSKHLLNPDHGFKFITAYDLDIKALVLVCGIIVVKILKGAINSCRNALFRKTNKPAVLTKVEPEVPLARKVY